MSSPHNHLHHKHDHSHEGHHHHHHHFSDSSSKLLLVFFLNLAMSIIEFFGGYSTNSTAILSDALHDFGDAIALGVGYILEKVSLKKSDGLFSFGYRRFSLLGALFSSVVLIIGSTLILTEVIPRLFEPESVKHQGMLLLAVLGIVVNGFSFFILSKGSSANEKVLSLHLLEDLLGWVAVLIVSIVMFFKELPILDPLLSICITTVILVNVYKNLKKIFYILLQGVPAVFRKIDIEKIFSENKNIQKIYHTHVWSLDGEKHVLTTHVVLREGLSIEEYKETQNWAHEKTKSLGLWHSTFEFEFSKNSSNSCT